MKLIGGILAGGRGRRMAGIDKPFTQLAGRPLIAHVIERLAPQTRHIIINANDAPERFASFGFEIIADHLGGYRGPLAGVQTLMQAGFERGASHSLIVPADTPFLPHDLAARLLAASSDDNTVRIAASQTRRHPVIALWPTSKAKHLAQYLETTDDLSMAAYMRQLALTVVEFPATKAFDPFFNINEPADIPRAETMIPQETTPGM